MIGENSKEVERALKVLERVISPSAQKVKKLLSSPDFKLETDKVILRLKSPYDLIASAYKQIFKISPYHVLWTLLFKTKHGYLENLYKDVAKEFGNIDVEIFKDLVIDLYLIHYHDFDIRWIEAFIDRGFIPEYRACGISVNFEKAKKIFKKEIDCRKLPDELQGLPEYLSTLANHLDVVADTLVEENKIDDEFYNKISELSKALLNFTEMFKGTSFFSKDLKGLFEAIDFARAIENLLEIHLENVSEGKIKMYEIARIISTNEGIMFECTLCNKKFKTFKGLKIHLAKRHKIKF